MASISCAHCKETHSSVAEVRACATSGTVRTRTAPDQLQAPLPAGTTPVQLYPTGTVGHVRGRNGLWHFEGRSIRRGYVCVSQDMGDYANTSTVLADLFVPVQRQRQADSDEDLMNAAVRQNERREDERVAARKMGGPTLKSVERQVRAGFYAVGPEDFTRFYRIDKPEEGPWAGYTFVKQVTGHNPAGNRIKAYEARREVLEAILAAGLQEATLRFGREIGRCGECGRTLTNDESRRYGVGPDCRAKLGW